MQEIPDTGGGVSGFIAWLLWHIYVYFPFEGTWDWLLLFFFLATVTRLAAVPASWTLVKWAIVKDGGNRRIFFALPFVNLLSQTGVTFFFISFFSKPAGRDFLFQRSGLELTPERVQMLFRGSAFVFAYAAFLAIGFYIDRRRTENLAIKDEALRFNKTMRVLADSSLLHICVVTVAHLVYWHWSIVSLSLMWVFSVVDAAVGVVFYYIFAIRDNAAPPAAQDAA